MSMPLRQEKLKSLILLGSILAILGLGISFYSLFHHLELKSKGDTSFMCNINDSFSCDDVANSRFAEDPWRNPLGIYGIGYFLGLFVLLMIARLKAELQKESLQTYALMVGIGVIVSLTLGGISHFVIGKLCPSCIGIYGVTILQAFILFFCRGGIPGPFAFKNISNGSWYALLALAVSIALFQLMKPSTSPQLTLDLPKPSSSSTTPAPEGKARVTPLDSLDAQAAPAIKIDASPYSGLGEDFRKGSDDAKVKIVEFADFQCPACATASKALRQLGAEFGDRIQIVFKSYPLDKACNPGMQSALHPFACEAAIMVRCAGNIGRFWEMHDQLFDNQSRIESSRITAWAKDLGLTDAQIQQCKNSKDIIAKIQDDIRQANEAGLTGTPTIFFNGRKYHGPANADEMRAVVQALLEG